MPWKTDLKREIEDNHLDVGIFTLEELYRVSINTLSRKYPKNNTIKASVRRTLQKLRDDNYLIFLNQGEYKVNTVSNDEFINFVKVYHNYQR